MQIADAKETYAQIAKEYPQYKDAMELAIKLVEYPDKCIERIDTFPIREEKSHWGVHGGFELAKEILLDEVKKIGV